MDISHDFGQRPGLGHPGSPPRSRMSSFIHYRFKSAKDYDTYKFEGAGVPVWELKQEIIQAKRLGKGMDFDLAISNAQTNEGRPRPIH